MVGTQLGEKERIEDRLQSAAQKELMAINTQIQKDYKEPEKENSTKDEIKNTNIFLTFGRKIKRIIQQIQH